MALGIRQSRHLQNDCPAQNEVTTLVITRLRLLVPLWTLTISVDISPPRNLWTAVWNRPRAGARLFGHLVGRLTLVPICMQLIPLDRICDAITCPGTFPVNIDELATCSAPLLLLIVCNSIACGGTRGPVN